MNNAKKPLIALSPQCDGEGRDLRMRISYFDAIAAAGGIAVMTGADLSPGDIVVLLDRVDGVLLTGGGDLHPRLYGREIERGCGEIQSARDRFELALCRGAIERRIPLLGICRGMQVLNVALGGTLRQDIGGHSETMHDIGVEPESPFYALFGDRVTVNSFHHQCLERTARALRIGAVSGDGCPEAVWLPDRPFTAAVQWHPELLYRQQEAHFRLFRRFVQSCGVK